MRKFKFIGTEEDIFCYTPDIADNLVIGKIYSEEDLEGLYLDYWESPEKNLVKSDWEEVFEEQEQKSPEQYYAGGTNTLSISGTFDGVEFSLNGDFEKCLTVLDFISTLEIKK